MMNRLTGIAGYPLPGYKIPRYTGSGLMKAVGHGRKHGVTIIREYEVVPAYVDFQTSKTISSIVSLQRYKNQPFLSFFYL